VHDRAVAVLRAHRQLDELLVRERVGAGELVALVGLGAGIQRAHDALGDVVRPDRLELRAPEPGIGMTGSSARRARIVRYGSPGA
jgi:hypothetical protein